jgi:teichuronic acid exporter
MSLKQKTISGLMWSSFDNIASLGIQFIFGIILARLLTPKEFGLIGMLTIFIAVSQSFIDSGFANALIRKRDCTQTDYSTVFFYNLGSGILFFILLLFFAPLISIFFKEPELKPIIQVLAFVLIIDSLTIIQRTILTKCIDFKLQTRISIIASSVSGFVAILFAYKGFGVWSLVIQTLTKQLLNSFLLWIWNRWRPNLVFSKSSFKELFGFGSKLLISGLIDTIYQNVYYLIIGKYFSAKELGFYTRASLFRSLPNQNITAIMTRVAYPVLSKMQDNPEMLKAGYKKMIRSTVLVSFVLVLGLAAVAEPMIITLIGEPWRPSVIYLQLLCLSGLLYPLDAINLNMLNVQGRSDLFLRLEIIKKILAFPVIVVGVLYGIKIMITGMILTNFLSYYLNSYWSGQFIKYSTGEQVKDITPAFLLAAGMAITVYLLGHFLTTPYPVTLILQISAGAAIVFGLCELTKMPDYLYLKHIVVEKLLRRS